ncbi:MAG TPA: DUF4396 domain-containing protein [Gammaproteobacteria bacterium]|jgi:hypothetical protein|nr:DUF4396 domain-containing protein [Gammaproteobacteria bacterium]
MTVVDETIAFTWRCLHTWRQAAINTWWCLVGCSIGDFGTIWFFQWSGIEWPVMVIMSLAIVNGLLTSIALETIVLLRQMALASALRTACGMSMISMVSMEVAMNSVDVWVMGGATLSLSVLPLMLCAGFFVPFPYNYWRLKALGKACH